MPDAVAMKPRVFLHALPWDIKPRNMDWRYVRHDLLRLREYEPELEFVTETSDWVAIAGNLKTIRMTGWRVGMPLNLYSQITSRMARGELVRSGSNLIFTRSFPSNADAVPVIWESAIIDTDMQRNYGVTEAMLAEELEARGKLFRRSAAVQVFTESEAKRHAVMFPDIAERFVAVPYFTPHIKPCEREVVEKHRGAVTVRILFVGNQAIRKGLDQLLDAFLQLPASVQNRTILTVISNFDQGKVAVPNHDRIQVLQGAPSERVMEEMRQAHVFVNVARMESYGIVFPEAMSQGVACLGPNWEVQRELFDWGRAGMNLPCDTGAVRDALERVIEDEEFRYAMGLAAWERFRDRLAPEVSARGYAKLFHDVLHGQLK